MYVQLDMDAGWQCVMKSVKERQPSSIGQESVIIARHLMLACLYDSVQLS